jgi:hypothetical protein
VIQEESQPPHAYQNNYQNQSTNEDNLSSSPLRFQFGVTPPGIEVIVEFEIILMAKQIITNEIQFSFPSIYKNNKSSVNCRIEINFQQPFSTFRSSLPESNVENNILNGKGILDSQSLKFIFGFENQFQSCGFCQNFGNERFFSLSLSPNLPSNKTPKLELPAPGDDYSSNPDLRMNCSESAMMNVTSELPQAYHLSLFGGIG